MKKIVLVLLLILAPCYALDYGSYCPSNNASKSIQGMFMSASGINFTARKIAQKEIAKALLKETNSDFDVKVDTFWGVNIVDGEFKKFSATAKNYLHDNFNAESLTIETVCPYNKVSYKDDKLHFDTDMILKYNVLINQDNLSKMLKQKIQIINNKVAFDYKVSVFGIKTTLSLKAGLAIKDNKIELCDIEFNNKSLKAGKYLSLLNELTSFNVDLNKTTKANVKVDNVKIQNSKIYLSGFALIPKG